MMRWRCVCSSWPNQPPKDVKKSKLPLYIWSGYIPKGTSKTQSLDLDLNIRYIGDHRSLDWDFRNSCLMFHHCDIIFTAASASLGTGPGATCMGPGAWFWRCQLPRVSVISHVISHDLTNQKWSLNGSYTFFNIEKTTQMDTNGRNETARRDVSWCIMMYQRCWRFPFHDSRNKMCLEHRSLPLVDQRNCGWCWRKKKPLKNDGVRHWEGWHPIYEMENKKCLKPPTRSSIYHISSRFPTVPFLGATVDVDPGKGTKKNGAPRQRYGFVQFTDVYRGDYWRIAFKHI